MLAAVFYVLVQDLEMVVVYGFLVYEPDVFGAAVVANEVLYIVFLDFAGFFFDAVLGAGRRSGSC